MGEIEGELEKRRRELAIISDFNICDVYKMFTNLDSVKKGIDADDLYRTITENLGMEITKDEVHMIFFTLDKNGDGFLDRDETATSFMPREIEYAKILN
jgi:Ca2+-binding EF-hand superfamily protein